MNSLSAIIGDYNAFLETLFSQLEKINLQVEQKGFQLDHICYRASSKAEYQEIIARVEEANLGSKLVESMIGGRPIANLLLRQPIVYREFQIECLEITCPKDGKLHPHGLEHIEFAIGGDDIDSPLNTSTMLQEFMSKFPGIIFNLTAIDKIINADVSLSFGDINCPLGSVKFHAIPLRKVCIYELLHNEIVRVPESYFNT